MLQFLLEDEAGIIPMVWFTFDVWKKGKSASWLHMYVFIGYPWVKWAKDMIKASFVWRQEVMMLEVSWISATGKWLKLRWLRSFSRMTKLLKNLCQENLSHCVFNSNHCYEVGTALSKCKCNIEYSTKIHVLHPVKSICLLFGSWGKTLHILCSLKQNFV